MRCLIVDDEAPARAKLRRLLNTFNAQAGPGSLIDIAGEADNGIDALDLIARLQPDLVFLDVQMPELSGTDVVAQLPQPAPQIIFVTAFDAYAVRAFELNAVDYLLKPFDAERLQQAVQRALQRHAGGAASAVTAEAPLHRSMPVQNLLVREGDTTHVVAVSRILWLTAADNYVVIHCAGNVRHVLRQPLADLLQRLDSRQFVRAHRSIGVNLHAVQTVQNGNRGDGELVLHGGERLPLSRRCRESVLAALAALSGTPAR